MDINKAIHLASEYFQAGNLKQAEHVCKKILRIQPNNADTLHLLGIICYQFRNYDSAITYMKRALQFNPYNADAYFNLGNTFIETGQPDEAITCYQNTLQLNPNILDAYNNLGNAFMEKGKIDNAILSYQRAIQINPRVVDTYTNLGSALIKKGQFDEAISCYQKALQINPHVAIAHCNLGDAFQEKGQLDEAISCYQKALEINPYFDNPYNSLGTAFHKKGQYDLAISYYQKALQLNSDFTLAYCNMAKALHSKGQVDEAITYFQKALQLEPDLADAHVNMSLALLLSGDFKQGWREYEWRQKLRDFYKRDFSQPFWDGSDISGLTILIHAEQGYGDTIQFIRYAPLIAQRGAKVMVECLKELASLLKNVEGIDNIIVRDEQLPEFDVHCPLLSLPLVFNTALESIPANIPYITADMILVQKWRDKIKSDNSKLKIGLTWSGNPKHVDDQNRSCPLEIFSSFRQLNNITFYSLQKGEAAEQVKNSLEGLKFFDYTEELNDFSDTAAFIENLDLIISVDTAVAHLAGALGKPVWTLLPFVPDWRWMLNREDSLWYPTMRLFRQPTLGDWKSVIDKVAEELQKKII